MRETDQQFDVKYFEIVVRISLESFAVVNETGKDDDTQHQEKNEQRQFFSRRFKRVNLFNQMKNDLNR